MEMKVTVKNAATIMGRLNTFFSKQCREHVGRRFMETGETEVTPFGIIKVTKEVDYYQPCVDVRCDWHYQHKTYRMFNKLLSRPLDQRFNHVDPKSEGFDGYHINRWLDQWEKYGKLIGINAEEYVKAERCILALVHPMSSGCHPIQVGDRIIFTGGSIKIIGGISGLIQYDYETGQVREKTSGRLSMRGMGGDFYRMPYDIKDEMLVRGNRAATVIHENGWNLSYMGEYMDNYKNVDGILRTIMHASSEMVCEIADKCDLSLKYTRKIQFEEAPGIEVLVELDGEFLLGKDFSKMSFSIVGDERTWNVHHLVDLAQYVMQEYLERHPEEREVLESDEDDEDFDPYDGMDCFVPSFDKEEEDDDDDLYEE